jgi:peptidyl-prolyl cis-trans isomerase B (cyclophilin B)
MRLLATGLMILTAMSFGSTAAEAPMTAKAPEMTAKNTQVKLHTNLGDIVLRLDPVKAPLSTANFVDYVKEGFYNGTIFHRVIPGFMAQGGGFTQDFEQKSTHKPIQNEANNGLPNKRGSIAMARTSDPHSATAQFFINLADNGSLNHKSPTPQGWGYAVFGEVVEGMDVVDAMAKIPTGRGGPMPTDVPQKPIIIEQATVLEE